jgi:hypothetical protein
LDLEVEERHDDERTEKAEKAERTERTESRNPEEGDKRLPKDFLLI